MTPLMPLDIWRQEIGISPWHFWGLADTSIVPIVSKCSTLVLEYAWQGSDAAGRDDIRRALERAEEKLKNYLGYRVAPQYTEQTVAWPRHYEANQTRMRNLDATGRRIGIFAPEGYIQRMGIEQLTTIGAATVAGGTLVYSALFHPTLQDTFTITLPIPVGMTLTADQVAVYFASADRWDGTAVGERWRIQPISAVVSGGNVVITGRKWLLVKPLLYQNPVLQALNPTVAANFVTSLEVYQRTTDQNGNSVTTSQATLTYESNECRSCWGPCWCAGPPSSSDPGTVGQVIARAGIRDATLGLVTPGAATYDAVAGMWSSAWYCNFCDPDRVTLRYLAGAPLEDGQMAQHWQQVVAQLGAAELKRRICACRETNERLHDLQQDLTLESTETERYQVAPEDLSNPFGTRRGHVQAWRASKDYALRRGIAA